MGNLGTARVKVEIRNGPLVHTLYTPPSDSSDLNMADDSALAAHDAPFAGTLDACLKEIDHDPWGYFWG